MDSDIYHYDGLAYWGPIGAATMDRLIETMRPTPAGRALDVGCGRGEFLLRLVERHGIREVVGVDRSKAALEIARATFVERKPEIVPDLRECDADDLAFDDDSFEVVAWLGGPLLGDSFAATVARLTRWTRPGGYVLIGHGFWENPPAADYLATTGITADEFVEHWQNIEACEQAGLRSLYCCRSSRHEWDEFEGRILANVERYAIGHPKNPDPQGRLEQRRSWHRAQQRWGRDAMGFGLYLFQR